MTRVLAGGAWDTLRCQRSKCVLQIFQRILLLLFKVKGTIPSCTQELLLFSTLVLCLGSLCMVLRGSCCAGYQIQVSSI